MHSGQEVATLADSTALLIQRLNWVSALGTSGDPAGCLVRCLRCRGERHTGASDGSGYDHMLGYVLYSTRICRFEFLLMARPLCVYVCQRDTAGVYCMSSGRSALPASSLSFCPHIVPNLFKHRPESLSSVAASQHNLWEIISRPHSANPTSGADGRGRNVKHDE